jgi:hypothetical protein
MHHHLIAAAQSSLEKGSWTEGLIAFVIICLLVLSAGVALMNAARQRRQDEARARQRYEAMPEGRYDPHGTYRRPSGLV